MTLARAERRSICDTFLRVGPQAPTLCEGWDAYDLAAHLWLRENQPAARLAVMVARGRDERVRMNHLQGRLPFPRMVAELRAGPVALTPMRIPAVDRVVNGLEYFIHHEDLRRAGAQPLPPRELDEAAERELWVTLKRVSRLLFRRAPFGVDLLTRDGRILPVGKGRRVTIVGDVAELALYASGRTTAARVDVQGDPVDVDRLVASLGM